MPFWSPDTCGCKVEYTRVPGKSQMRENICERVVRACPAHEQLGKDALFSALCTENCDLKNGFSREIENRRELFETVSLPNGSVGERMKGGLEYRWAFDQDRNLVVDLEGFPPATAAALAAATAANRKIKFR